MTTSNEQIVLFNGDVDSSTDLKAIIKSVALVGTHHCFQVRTAQKDGPVVLSVWGMSAGEGASDRGYTVLCELLRLLSCQSAVLPFSNSVLTQLLEADLTMHEPGVVLTLDEGVADTGSQLKRCLKRRKRCASSLPVSEKLSALKTELFLMENDADAYEDEIRRLNDVIHSLRNQSTLC